MADWGNLPPELLTHVYSFLPRRDRLSCSLVCQNWKDGMDHVMLWKVLKVCLDTDLKEPSTVLLLRDYSRYLKKLELGWAFPDKPTCCHHELTKRAVRFLLILHDTGVQIEFLRIFNWCDLRKITYHASRFLGKQLSLSRVVVENTTVHSPCFTKMLAACLNYSRHTITHFDIQACHFCRNVEGLVYFQSVMDQLQNLTTLKLNYLLLSCKIIDSILISKNNKLENLEVSICKNASHDQVISGSQWQALRKACPKLRVTIVVWKICHYDVLQVFLKQEIPLVSFSINFYGTKNCHFRKTLGILAVNYHKTLESLTLQIRNDAEILDDLLLTILRRCTNLRSLLFHGTMRNPNILKSAVEDLDDFLKYPEKYVTEVFNKRTYEEIHDQFIRFLIVRHDVKNGKVFELKFTN